MNRAEMRRAARAHPTAHTYDQTDPAYVPIEAVHPDMIVEDGVDRWTFPPFTSLVASGIEQAATILGVHGAKRKADHMRGITERLRERWGNGT